ncbi:MAG: chlorophyll synthesis pathway protein BchC [Burkholderiaceae bacterium]|jgi:3-hydroxyethyl bacteriochlorophyllide a dehydrogenase
MKTTAIVFESPGHITSQELELVKLQPSDVLVEIDFSGISTGTERLLWSGKMPPFPGLGYPLVPGYESVGRVIEAGDASGLALGQLVFVPGSRSFATVQCLFGGAARHLVVAGSRAVALPPWVGEEGVLMALAATAYHMLKAPGANSAELVIGHGVLGRLLARLSILLGEAPPTVWEEQTARRDGAAGYTVTSAAADARKDYRAIYDVSGDSEILDQAIARLAKGGEIVLGGFYSDRLAFSFAPAFTREARLRVAAEFSPADLVAVIEMVAQRHLSLEGLVTHRAVPEDAQAAYRSAFSDPLCLKMVLDWRNVLPARSRP